MQNKSRRHSMADLQKVLKKHSPKTPVKRMAPIRALSSPADAKRNAVTKSAGSAHQSEMMTSMLRLVAKNQKMAEFRKTHHARAAARTRRKDLAALGMDVESSKEVTKSVGETATRAVITVLTKRLSRLRTAEVVRTVLCAGAPPRNHIGQQLTPRCSLSLSLSLLFLFLCSNRPRSARLPQTIACDGLLGRTLADLRGSRRSWRRRK